MKEEIHYRGKGSAVDGFGKIVGQNLTLETMAVSKAKAKCNFESQIKTKLKLAQNSRIKFIGTIEEA